MKGEQYKLPTDLILDIKSRLKTLSGQINGIVKMLDEGKDPEQINIQFRSIDKGFQCNKPRKIDRTPTNTNYTCK